MEDEIIFCTKSFAEVSNGEVADLLLLSRKNESFFKVFLANLKDGTVKNPEQIFITQAIKQNKPVAWLFEDCAGEYNKYRENKFHCSIHVFCAHAEREKGITQRLFEFRREELAKHPKLISYVSSEDLEFHFYKKMRDRFQLRLKIESPTYYSRNYGPSKEKK